jgi:hypothetical protein
VRSDDFLAQPGRNHFAENDERKDRQKHGRRLLPVENVDRALQDQAYAARADKAKDGRFPDIDVPAQDAD